MKVFAIETIQPGARFHIGDITIDPFTIPHDAVDPVAFRLSAEGVNVAVCTDLGYIPQNVKEHLRGSHFLVMESNHDVEMLRSGPYPWTVKQRVMSRTGHLSNNTVCEFLASEDFDHEARVLVLAHLSEHNNHPEIARLAAAAALQTRNATDTKLTLAAQGTPTELFQF
jgi:phosphoribosyl 1,2-cyclic phosphodiesterase